MQNCCAASVPNLSRHVAETMCFSHSNKRIEVARGVSDLRLVAQEMVLAQFPTFREVGFSGAPSDKVAETTPIWC
jgi:hypothetical protein